MKTKLILVDLDLTLLKSDGTLSEHTVQVLKKCREQGILVGFCTSRGTTRIEQYEKAVEPEVVICNAGASIFYKGELIHSENFTLEETHRLFKRVYEVCGENAEITVDTLYDFFWNKKEDKSSMYMPEAKFDDLRNFEMPAMKFCVQLTDSEKARLIADEVENCSTIKFSDIPWYKFSPKSASKENGIKFISEYLKIQTEEMISFGDDFSDIEMLRTTGVGVAMGNAIPEVKEAADDMTLTCDQDGVAYYIEEKVLKEYNFYGWRKAEVSPADEKYLKIKNPRKLYDLLLKIWCAETCAPRMRAEWSKDNPTRGQCSITAFLAQDIFGGQVYGILREGGNYHCYNVIENCKFDLTSEQFGNEKLYYENNPLQTRQVHFSKEEKRLRYEYLKGELEKLLEKEDCFI